MNVLVVAAHPDDEVLGCGGTIARLIREGHQVYIGILGEGITSRYPSRDDAREAERSRLLSASREAAALLGADEPILHELPDNRFDTVPLLDVVKLIEDLVERFRPAVVFTQHGGDLNVDHEVVFRATLTATRPQATCPVKEVYAFEVPSSTDWAFGQFQPRFRPNVFMDVGATLETKIRAMQLYESEARLFPHPRSPEALRALAQHWGSTSGTGCAEAFELIRSVRNGAWRWPVEELAGT
ncbi:MAG: PIG-L family deacetylase [Gemmatimonadetes bacterium]|nr:PIG-L family deacetylase [Gemmatimonadota bacterium]